MKLKDTNALSKREAEINIILQDEEMEELIRKLVIKAKGAGVCITNLNQATKMVWEEVSAQNGEVIEYILTPDQEMFVKKVDAFLEHYGKDLIEDHNANQRHGSSSILNSDNPKRVENFIACIRDILISMYLVFEKEPSVTQKHIMNYSKNYLNSYFRFSITEYLRDIRNFFNSIAFSKEQPTSLPQYCSNHFGYEYKIWKQADFIKFSSQYEFKNNSASGIAICVIWFITKFF